MKQFIHVCFTSHKEVMFRDAQDVGMMLNFIALCSWKYDVEVLADAEMSTHVHLVMLAKDSKNIDKASDSNIVSAFINSLRKRYTCYFNNKYHRPANVRFGERGYFYLEVYGNCHMQTAMSYVLRNPWHHGVAGTPFAYPFSSINDIFPLELGKMDRPMITNPKVPIVRRRSNGRWVKDFVRNKSEIVGKDIWCPSNCQLITSRQEMSHYIPRYSDWPDDWVMSSDHVFLRPCFEDLKQTERLYVTPGAFEYAMFRKTDERMIDEQNLDNNGKPPVGLSDVEPEADEEIVKGYLMNEKSGTFKSFQSDFDVCYMVDTQIVPVFGRMTVYEMNQQQLQSVGTILEHELHVPDCQVRRCLPLVLFT